MKTPGLLGSAVAVAGALLAISEVLAAQGVTTAALDGQVMDEAGAPIAQATVEVFNASNGQRWRVETNAGGRYFLEYLPVGGPYRLVARAIGFRPTTRPGIALALGQRQSAAITLHPEAYRLDELTVETAEDPLLNSGRTGPAQIVSDSTIRRRPNGTRDIIKLATLSPQVRTSSATVNGFSVDGQNSRFNSFQVDGVARNDRFAFSGSGGLPGAAVDAHLIGIEAVQELQILTSPFDVRYGNFAGGLVNLVTKSGTNRIHGTLFGYFKNQSLTGEDAEGNEPGPFTTVPFGATLGGPIVRDRVHFFLSADLSRLDSPYAGPLIGSDTANGADSAGVGIRYASAVRFQRVLRERYGLEAGLFDAEDFHLPTRDWLAKVTAQLGVNSRLEVSQHVSSGHISGFQACRSAYDCYSLSSSDIVPRFRSSGTRVIWSQLVGGRVANELIVGYLRLRDRCETSGFPLLEVHADEGVLQAGAPPGCSTFGVSQNALELSDNATFAIGAHRFTIGTHNELLSLDDAFFFGATGSWEFESLDSLELGIPSAYHRSLPGARQPSGPTAKFRVRELGLYVQDQWNPTTRLTFTAGLRVDIPFVAGRPTRNPAVLSKFGVNTAQLPSGNASWSPRLGFNYDVTGRGTTSVRGGLGLFAGPAPYSWLAGAFKSTGLEQLQLSCEGAEAPAFDPVQQPTTCGAGPTQPLPTVNYFDPGVKYPQTLKLALGLDQRLPWGTVGTIDIVYTRGVHQLYYDDVNLLPPVSVSRGEDGRPLYGTIDPDSGLGTPLRRSPDFGPVIRVRDGSGDHALSLAFQLQKRFTGGLELAASYAYLAARDLETLANTLPLSLVQATPLDGTLDDRRVRPAQDDRTHRVHLSGSADLPLGLRLSVFYLGGSGPRFTYTIDGDANADGVSTRFPGGSNEAVYVPADIRPGGDIELAVLDEATQLFVPAPAEDYARLASFIGGESCLRANQGHLLPRNSCREGWESESRARLAKVIDLGADRSLELSVDVVNFLHLVSRDWGRFRTIAGGVETSGLLHLVGYAPDAQRGIYEFVPPHGAFDKTPPWEVQLGARYSF